MFSNDVGYQTKGKGFLDNSFKQLRSGLNDCIYLLHIIGIRTSIIQSVSLRYKKRKKIGAVESHPHVLILIAFKLH